MQAFSQELPTDWDRFSLCRGLATVSWAHTENRVLPYRKQDNKPTFRERIPVELPELLMVEYDWEWSTLEQPFHLSVTSHFWRTN